MKSKINKEGRHSMNATITLPKQKATQDHPKGAQQAIFSFSVGQ
jgi:hypothetical protein